MYTGPGKMTAMPMANGAMGHDAMMKNATKVQDNTVFFMQGNQLYMAYREARCLGQFLPAVRASFRSPTGRPPLRAASPGK